MLGIKRFVQKPDQTCIGLNYDGLFKSMDLISLHCNKDNSNNINVWLEILRVGVKNKLCSNLIYSIGP